MGGWHQRLNGHGFEQALGVGDGQGDLVCCGPRDRKESDTTERLSWGCSLFAAHELLIVVASLVAEQRL